MYPSKSNSKESNLTDIVLYLLPGNTWELPRSLQAMAPLNQLGGHINATCAAENSTGTGRARPHAYYALSYCALILAIVFGNVLVCVAVLKERALQTTTNYLVVSLAVADLLVATLVMPWVVYLEVSRSQVQTAHVTVLVFVIPEHLAPGLWMLPVVIQGLGKEGEFLLLSLSRGNWRSWEQHLLQHYLPTSETESWEWFFPGPPASRWLDLSNRIHPKNRTRFAPGVSHAAKTWRAGGGSPVASSSVFQYTNTYGWGCAARAEQFFFNDIFFTEWEETGKGDGKVRETEQRKWEKKRERTVCERIRLLMAQLPLDSALSSWVPVLHILLPQEKTKFLFLMPPLIVQSPHPLDNAADPGEFFQRETFLKFESIFIGKCKTESGGDQDKTSIC